MNYGQMKQALRALVDRPDMSDAKAGEFIQRAVGNLERSPLRLGFQKRLVHAVMDGQTNSIAIPGDYLELIDLFTDTHTFSQVVLGTWQRAHGPSCSPIYMAMGQNFLVKPTPAAGEQIHMHYYAEAQRVVVDTDENGWTKSASEAVLYTAARMAADFYQIDQGQAFQAQADREIALLDEQDSSEEWAGDMSIELPHPNIC